MLASSLAVGKNKNKKKEYKRLLWRQIVLLWCQLQLSALTMLLIEVVSAFSYCLDSLLLLEDIIEAQSFKRHLYTNTYETSKKEEKEQN